MQNIVPTGLLLDKVYREKNIKENEKKNRRLVNLSVHSSLQNYIKLISLFKN
jgi:hypothetical protein